MDKLDNWTKDKSVESLLRVIETGKNSEVLTAIRLLNTMYGFNEPKENDEDSKLDGKIEVMFVGCSNE